MLYEVITIRIVPLIDLAIGILLSKIENREELITD